MRLGTVMIDGRRRLAECDGRQWRIAGNEKASVLDVITGAEVAFDGGEVRIEDAEVTAPFMPPTIFGIGLNFRDTVIDMGWETPSTPYLFPKLSSSVTGPRDPIVVDENVTERADWEAELAVIIGRTCRSVSADAAHDVVFGYAPANDISARDLQEQDGQWVRGKGLDTFCPLGSIVTADEAPDVDGVRIRTWVNDEIVQDGTTADMIFGIPQLIEYLSTWFTLRPGDVILTGTPAGCGDFRSPRRSLRPGDVVNVDIEGVGELSNPVVSPFR